MKHSDVPLFPLRTVLYPGGPLALRVFEPRYLDMVSDCLRTGSNFGVVAIETGAETGAATFHETGTLARIVDWYQERDGILGIVAVGLGRFRVLNSSVRRNGLRVADIDSLAAETARPVPARYGYMSELMESIIDQLGDHYALIDKNFDDASWLGFRFAEILPISLGDKQRYLESNDPIERLAALAPVLNALSAENGDMPG